MRAFYYFCPMNLEDFFVSPKEISCETWQLGSLITSELQQGSVALIFCSDDRGSGGDAEPKDFTPVREELYRLSKLDFEVPICDLGDLISGKTTEDTHYILQEILVSCYKKSIVTVVIGGSNDLAFSLFKAIDFQQKKLNYTQISPIISLKNDGKELSETNFLNKILSDKNLKLKDYTHLGYQKHLNETDVVRLMSEMGFPVLRLADMMNSMEHAEPFLRRADLVSLNCDAVESFAGQFSVNPQVNGLNNREICACMKEIGMGERLKSVGIFNYNSQSRNRLHHQLLAQMIWYFFEGVNIQRSHPKDRKYETFIVLIDDMELVFKRDIFSGLWYFGKDDDIKKCLPCSATDYENAKKGIINPRFSQ